MDQRHKDRKGSVPEPLLATSSRAQPATLRPQATGVREALDGEQACVLAPPRPRAPCGGPPVLHRRGCWHSAPQPTSRPLSSRPLALWVPLPGAPSPPSALASVKQQLVHLAWSTLTARPSYVTCLGCSSALSSFSHAGPFMVYAVPYISNRRLVAFRPLQMVSSPRAGLSLPPRCLTLETGTVKFAEQTSETRASRLQRGLQGTAGLPEPNTTHPLPTCALAQDHDLPLGHRTETPGTLDRKHRLSASENHEIGSLWGLHLSLAIVWRSNHA